MNRNRGDSHQGNIDRHRLKTEKTPSHRKKKIDTAYYNKLRQEKQKWPQTTNPVRVSSRETPNLSSEISCENFSLQVQSRYGQLTDNSTVHFVPVTVRATAVLTV